MSIQIALSVGEPVKNRDTSELKEFVALTPRTMRYDAPSEQGDGYQLIHIYNDLSVIDPCQPVTLPFVQNQPQE